MKVRLTIRSMSVLELSLVTGTTILSENPRAHRKTAFDRITCFLLFFNRSLLFLCVWVF